ncbi:MAG TPA: hypothetical protein VEH62_00375 [Gemmatimonadales bacterium]|nr:hypothetical protein [Gemmatimonadales bacterium]
MPCSYCGFERVVATGRTEAAPGAAEHALGPTRCERCGAPLPSVETVAAFHDKMRLLAQFGLASDTRLMLETSSEDT